MSVHKFLSPAQKISFFVLLGLCLSGHLSSGLALLLGAVFSGVLGNPFLSQTTQFTPRLLQMAVVGLGAGMNLGVVGQVGLQGFGYTAIGIFLTGVMGLLLGRLFRIERDTSLLVTVGTAICGGSAIAAVASTIKAKSEQVSVALATVFFLNASALFIFPFIGTQVGLSPAQFGLWSALAIHDTSSVVGAALQYSPDSVEIATTVKLARALWIIPVSFFVGMFWHRRKSSVEGVAKPKIPYFIFWFVAVAAVVTWIPVLQPLGAQVSFIAKRILVLTLFLIGSNLTPRTIRSLGVSPLIQGFFLWLMTGAFTLAAILGGWIQ